MRIRLLPDRTGDDKTFFGLNSAPIDYVKIKKRGQMQPLKIGGFMRVMKMSTKILPGLFVAAMLVTTAAGQTGNSAKPDSSKAAMHAKQLKPQTTCPVTGDPINKNLYVDYKGQRIFVCCADCIDMVKKSPKKYIKKLESMGQGVETISDKTKRESANGKSGTAMKEMKMNGMKMSGDSTSKTSEAAYWTCPMHPEVHKSAAGKCPMCGMDLEYKKAGKTAPKMEGMDRDLKM
jgi:YHS domain-containing protein